MKKLLRFAVAVAVVAGLVAPAMAQEKRVVEERSGVILKISGRNMVVRNDKNEIKRFTGIPAEATVTIDGKPVRFSDLREGMVYKAVRLEDVPPAVTVTMSEVEAMPSTQPAVAPPVEAPVAAAPAAPAAAPAPQTLPSTGSSLPLLGWLGLGLLGTGFALRRVELRGH